jgi:hypothetical protein
MVIYMIRNMESMFRGRPKKREGLLSKSWVQRQLYSRHSPSKATLTRTLVSVGEKNQNTPLYSY